MKKFVWGAIALLAVIALSFSIARYIDVLERQRDNEKAKYELLKSYTIVKAIQDSLQTIKHQKDSLVVVAEYHSQRAEKIRTIIKTIPAPAQEDSTNPRWKNLYEQRTAENEERREENVYLRSVLKNDSAEIAFLKREGDVWKRQALLDRPTPSNRGDCRVLVWRCPSRKMTFVAGAVVTLLGIAYIRD